MTSLRWQACWAKLASLWGMLTSPACHLTKFVNKADLQTYLSTKIGITIKFDVTNGNTISCGPGRQYGAVLSLSFLDVYGANQLNLK
jgi:hypothetical protein